MKRTIIFLAAMAVAIGISVHAKDSAKQLKIGDAAPEISVKPINDKDYEKKYELSQYKDKVIVLEFWATWCPPCRKSIPHISKLQEKYKDKVVFIGISTEGKDEVEKFYKEQKEMKYRVAIDDKGLTSGIYMGGFGVDGIPHAFIIKDGKIVWHGHPMQMEKDLETAVSGK